jgi:ribonuclease J
MLKKINAEGKDKYLIIMTGHQGEPKSCLAKLARGEYDVALGAGDYVVFSCKVIPTPTNHQNREVLEREIRLYGASIF